MTNTEILNKILCQLEVNHLNLYHDVTKQSVVEFINGVRDWDTLNNVEFDCKMKQLFALFKDAHTGYFVSGKYKINHKIVFVQNDFYVFYDNKYIKILKIGKINTDEYYERVKKLINYETQEWLNCQINMAVNNAYYYQMLGLIENGKLQLEFKNGEILYLDIVDKDLLYKDSDVEPIYSFKVLDNGILYVKYSVCVEDKDYPFAQFVLQIKKLIEEKNLKKYILDVRNNKGGDSKILNPLQDLIVDKKLKGYVLMNNGTFSSGGIAVYRMKKHANAIIIGENSGGKICSYGQTMYLNVENKRFSCSTKLFDFSDFFGYNGSIRPDVYVAYTIDDLFTGRDSQFEKAVELLVN